MRLHVELPRMPSCDDDHEHEDDDDDDDDDDVFEIKKNEKYSKMMLMMPGRHS